MICRERSIGLTKLHHEISEGLHGDLRQLQEELDAVVVSAYGWPASVAADAVESNRRLAELNTAIAAGEIAYAGPRS